VLDSAEYSAFKTTLNSSIVSYRIVFLTNHGEFISNLMLDLIVMQYRPIGCSMGKITAVV